MSETDFLKLKKHDNVETNTEKFDIENYLNGNWDKINENAKKVNTDISNINSKNKEQETNIEQLQENTETSSNKIAQLEKELKEAQEDFYQASIRGQASGEYIHVEDSSNCRAKIEISGNSEQETRSGKNYLNTLAKYKSGEKVTVDGITYTFNEDGSITCNGTATADSVLTFSSNLQTINGSGKKIVGMITGTQVPAKLSILAYTSDWSKNTFELLSNVNKNITINMQENIDYAIFRIIAYKGTTLNNQTIYYQILDTSVNDLTYEQYGVSPSPGYPSEIKTVGDNINLYPGWESGTVNITSGEKVDDPWYIRCKDFIPIDYGVFYTISQINSVNFDDMNCSMRLYDKDKKYLGSQYVGDFFKQSLTFTVNNLNVKYIIPVASNGKTIPQNAKTNIKLEKGTVAASYSKYGQGSVKVTKCNKNLFDKDNITLSEKNYNLDDNGKLISQGSWRVVNYIKVKPNTTYTLSGVIIPNKWTHRISEYDAQLVHIKQNQKTFDGFHTFTTSSTTKYIRFNLIFGNNGFDYDLSSIQLEENKKKTTLVQHEEQSYIMPTQAEMLEGDTFDFDNEEEVHVWGKKILTGEENWNASWQNSAQQNSKSFALPTTFFGDEIPNFDLNAVHQNLSSHFPEMFNTVWSKDTDCIAISSDSNLCLQIRLTKSVLKYTDATTTDELKKLFQAWIKSQYDAGTPVVVYYQLETPIRLKFTDEQKAVAKELNNARTYKNVTNITTDSKAILSLDYAKDLETLLKSTSEEV